MQIHKQTDNFIILSSKTRVLEEILDLVESVEYSKNLALVSILHGPFVLMRKLRVGEVMQEDIDKWLSAGGQKH